MPRETSPTLVLPISHGLMAAAHSGGTVLRFPPPAPKPDARALVAQYFERVYPARGHGATDCGEYLDGSGHLPDGDHLLAWLASRGFVLVLK